MLAVTYSEYGDPSVLEVTEVPEPHAGPGQVRIAVRTAGVNPADWKIRSGMFKGHSPATFPVVPGLEAAGVVDEGGDGVTDFRVGNEVFGLGQATSAEFAVLDHFAAKPAALTWEQAGGLALGAETALRGLERLGLTAGQTIVIDGAAGAVGSGAAQFAIADGCTVIGTASPSNHDQLRALGVIPTTYGPGLPERVAALAPGGVDAALDTAGRGSLPDLIQIVGSADKVVTIADFSAAEHGVRVASTQTAFHALPRAAHLAEEGKFTVAIDSEYPLSEAAKAHERSQGGHLHGKIVLEIAEG